MSEESKEEIIAKLANLESKINFLHNVLAGLLELNGVMVVKNMMTDKEDVRLVEVKK